MNYNYIVDSKGGNGMGNTVIQLRNDTASNWTSNNPTLALGEMGLETDTNKFKFGDGSTAWNSLAYSGGSAGSFKYGLYTMSGNQTTNLSAGNHIEFDTSSGSLGGLATGAGQADGIITLSGGKSYKIMCAFGSRLSSSSGYIQCQPYDRTNSTYVGVMGTAYPSTSTLNIATHSTCIAVVSPASSIDIDIRFIGSSSPYTIRSSDTWLLIEEYGGY